MSVAVFKRLAVQKDPASAIILIFNCKKTFIGNAVTRVVLLLFFAALDSPIEPCEVRSIAL
jgi:hypothetical protein